MTHRPCQGSTSWVVQMDPGAHAHAQGVCTAVDEAARLPAGDHVAADDLQVWVRPLDMRQHLQLVGGVPCTGMHTLTARLPGCPPTARVLRWSSC